MSDNPQTTGPRDAPAMLRDWIKSGIGGLDLRADLRAAASEMERDKSEIARLRVALTEIERMSQRAGGVGQIARDALRIGG